MSGQDRRRYPRYEVQEARGLLAFSVEAKILNLSLTGVAIETSSALRIGQRYSFRIGGGEGGFSLPGTVRWSTLLRTEKTPSGDFQPIFEAGLAFDDLLSPTGEGLRRFLEDHVVLDTESRLCGRFRPVSAQLEVAQVSAEFAYTVVLIGLGGMLISTDYSLALDEVFCFSTRLNGDTLETLGRIANVRELREGGEGAHTFLIGVEFRETAEAQRRTLQEFIRHEMERMEAEG
jgi:hypothetical protein